MQTRRIGSLEASLVGLGCNNFGRIDQAATTAVVDAAIANGVTFLDTADVYGGGLSEEYLGVAIRGRRDQVVLASKFGYAPGEGFTAGDPRWVAIAVRASLDRLGVDHIDLYQQHVPDPDVPVAETLGALQALVDEGLVREVGCSNVSADQLREADGASAAAGAPRFVSCQNRYSLLHREPEAEVLPACADLGVGFLPFFPLESGLLTGKYRDGMPDGARLTVRDEAFTERFLQEPRVEAVEALARFAEERGHDLLELAFSWLASHPRVASVIAGATTPAQVEANAAACAWSLTEDDRVRVDELTPAPSGEQGG